jgi:hypothetical protein
MRFAVYLLVLLGGWAISARAQVKIGYNPTVVNGNALLQLETDPATPSGAGKGLLLPILTDLQLPAASAALQGMLIFNSTQNCLQVCNGTAWQKLVLPGSKTKQYTLSALSFNAEGTYNRTNLAGGIYIGDGIAGTQGNLFAGVNLPDGAVVTGIDAYVLDNDATASRDIAYVQLWRQSGAVGTSFGNAINMGQTVGTSGASAVIQKISTSSISSSTIDNANYCYYLRVGSFQANTNLMLFKVVITYTITSVD